MDRITMPLDKVRAKLDKKFLEEDSAKKQRTVVHKA